MYFAGLGSRVNIMQNNAFMMTGWGAAKALCEGGCRVTIIDAIPDPTGRIPMLSSTGKPIEPGQKGFWYDYPNIASLVQEVGLKEKDVFTPFLNSSFYSPQGLEATAPVFSSTDLPQLPSPLGQVFASFKHFTRLPITDRASIVGLLAAMIDLYRDEETFRRYDKMSAYDLFVSLGVTKRLIDDFLRPTLLVGLFKPPEELSAAVSMELLYYYALAHQTSFDVRWLRRGTVSNTFFSALYRYLDRSGYNITVEGSSRVNKLVLDPETNRVTGVQYTKVNGGESNIRTGGKESSIDTRINPVIAANLLGKKQILLNDVDAVVLAVGAKGMRSVLQDSPALSYASPQLSKASALRAIDCISCRFYLDRKVSTLSPANVFVSRLYIFC